MAALVQRIRARAASLPTFDIPFLLILLLLLSYGLIMLFSAGYAVALYRRGDAYTYIRPQLLFAALGVLAMYAASLVDYHVWHRLAWPMLAGRMRWSIRCRSWEDFPLTQKFFAVGEAMAHLDYLEVRGRVCRRKIRGKRVYFAGAGDKI